MDQVRLERTVNTKDVGALETRLSDSFCDQIEINFLSLQGRFLATLVTEADPNEPEGVQRPILRASGKTIVEAVMELELIYQKLINM